MIVVGPQVGGHPNAQDFRGKSLHGNGELGFKKQHLSAQNGRCSRRAQDTACTDNYVCLAMHSAAFKCECTREALASHTLRNRVAVDTDRA